LQLEDRQTFEDVNKHINTIKNILGPTIVNTGFFVLLGLKSDTANRQVSYEEGIERARSINRRTGYLECSSKTDVNVSNLMERLISAYERFVAVNATQLASMRACIVDGSKFA
jgi:hypothetical protein